MKAKRRQRESRTISDVHHTFVFQDATGIRDT